MEEKEEFIYCDRCGNKMRSAQRCCIKCGNINFLNSDNDSMRKFAKRAEKINKQSLLENNRFVKHSDSNMLYADQAGSLKLCLLFNSIIYIISLILVNLLGSSLVMFNINENCKIIVLSLGVTYFHFFLLSMQIFYMRANKKWYSIFIPFYGSFKWFEITMDNGWLFLTGFIPIVGGIFCLISFYSIGLKFRKNEWLCFLFPYIMIIYLAFSQETLYRDVKFVFGRKYDDALVVEYQVTSFILKYVALVTAIGILVFACNYIYL